MKKKINKKHIFILSGVLALLVVGIVGLVLLQKSELFRFAYEVELPTKESNIVIDENTSIDGKRDEKFWNDNTLVFTETKSGINVTSWAHLGEHGLYLFTETDDTSVYWSKEKQFFENDSVEYYIDPRPQYSMQLDALKSDVKVRTDNIQVRVDTEGRSSTWFGRKTESGYPWVAGDFEVLTASIVDGEANKKDGAKGYSVETFIPWEAMGLETTPEEIGVMPAFNNVDNREDTARKWFTVKGMNHGAPTSYARVDKDGFVQIADGIELEKELKADWNDKAYKGDAITLTEVNATNTKPEVRGELKAFLGDEGVYFLVAVKDKVLSRYADGIWDNDGIEIVIDTQAKGGDNGFHDGIFRLAVDVDEGIETDICMTGYDDYVAVRRAVFCKTSVSEYKETSAYDYKNTLVFEVMVPYSSMGLSKKPSQISFAWAVKTPNETSYILNRRNGIGGMEGQDWLWSNRHYPQNPGEYYLLTSKGLEGDYTFPTWTAWDKCKVRSQASTRYDYRGYAAKDGLYINMVQYVDQIKFGGVSGKWKDITHIEMELWNGDVGYGWDGTYLAFFPDGSHYTNSQVNVTDLEYTCTITDRGAGYKGGFRYELSYEIYLGFENNKENPADGPYAFVQMMSCTPGESKVGYENSIRIVKDEDRKLWADDCKSYEFREDGIVARDTGTNNEEPQKPSYNFPKWTAWEDLTVHSDVPTRYDYRGFAADDGLYLNVVQYVDKVKQGGVADTWKDITHVEMELWNGDVGYGWDGTYLAFFPDGSHYINSDLNVTALEYQCTVTDRGANYADGYRFELSYEIYLGFENNMANPEDGPYAFIQFMSHTPGETEEGYEKAETITKDGDRKLWTEESKSVEFREDGAARKDSVYDISAYEDKIAQYKQDWEEKGKAGETTIFIGDSFFDGEFWSTFYDLYWSREVLRCGVSSSTSYDWEVFTTEFLKDTNPKNIVMHIGTNNIYDDNKNAEVTVKALQRMFSYMHETLPTTNLYYFGISLRTYDEAKIAIAKEVNAAMETWCADKDYITFIGSTVERLTGDMLRDNVHPREDSECNAYKIFVEELANSGIEMGTLFPAWENCTVRSKAQGRYDYRGYAADDGVYINMVQYVDTLNVGGTSGVWKDITHVEMELFNHGVGYGWDGTYMAFFPDGSYYINNETNVTGMKYACEVTDRGAEYADGYRYKLSYEIYLGFENNKGSQDGPYAYVQFMSHTPGETSEGYERSVVITKDGDRNLWTDDCKSYEFRKTGIVNCDDTPTFAFPTVADFTTINADLQSVDPNLYNFQMWTTDSGLYTYFVQKVPTVTLNNSDNWKNTHVEMEIWQGDFGHGWGGTYIALFPDETLYINNEWNVKSKNLHVNINDLANGETEIEYYFYLEFDNNLNSSDPSYAYVKQYQFLPGVSTTGLHSQVITRDGRQLITGTENSFQVHESIDAKMNN